MLEPEKHTRTEMISTRVRNARVQLQALQALRNTCKQNITTDSTSEQEERKADAEDITQLLGRILVAPLSVPNYGL